MAVPLQRLRIDLRDFDPAGVATLAGGAQTPNNNPWVAVGKHLCGAATDFALLCLARAAGDCAGGRREDAVKAVQQPEQQQGSHCRAAEDAGGWTRGVGCGAPDVLERACGAGCARSGAA